MSLIDDPTVPTVPTVASTYVAPFTVSGQYEQWAEVEAARDGAAFPCNPEDFSVIHLSDLKVGDIIHATFYDHCGDWPEDGLPEFEAFGRVSDVTDLRIELKTWAWVNPKNADAYPDNEDTLTLIRSAITKLEVLRLAK